MIEEDPGVTLNAMGKAIMDRTLGQIEAGRNSVEGQCRTGQMEDVQLEDAVQVEEESSGGGHR